MRAARGPYDYSLYGLNVRSDWQLPYSAGTARPLGQVGLLRGSPARFSQAIGEVRALGHGTSRSGSIRLHDGRTYLSWPDHLEFIISADGRTIAARSLRRTSAEVFHSYLLGQAFSFALVKQGLEPLHATAVVIDGTAIAFLGESGYGKSSLGAAFLRSGAAMLTDDLLVLSADQGGFVAYPGPPRMKLFPDMAGRILGPWVRGTPVAPGSRKLLIPLDARDAWRVPAPLGAIYVLAPRAREGGDRPAVAIRRLSKRQAWTALLRNTFNTAVTDPARLAAQFAWAANVAGTVPVRRLSYKRQLGLLPRVRHAVVEDLLRHRTRLS